MAMAVAADQGGLVYGVTYRRVSTNDGDQEASLRAQRDEGTQYVVGRGWVLAGEYEDRLKGTREDRRDYQRMLADVRRMVREGKRVTVTVAALDRLGRSTLAGARCRDELSKLGVEIHYVRECGPLDPLRAGMLQLIAEEEVRRLGQRVKQQWKYFRGHGWTFIGRVGFGYKTRPSTQAERLQGATKRVLDVDRRQERYAAEVFQRIAGDPARGVPPEPQRSVLRWFTSLPADIRTSAMRGDGAEVAGEDGEDGGNGRAAPSPRCGNKVSFRRMLRSPLYIARDYPCKPDGSRYAQQELDAAGGPLDDLDAILAQPKGNWPAIVSDDVWLRARQRMLGHKITPHQASGEYLLTGVLRCPSPSCGARMQARVATNGPARYACGGRDLGAHAPDAGCTATAAMASVDAVIRAELGAILGVLITGSAKMQRALEKRWQEMHRPDPATTDVAKRIAQQEAIVRRSGEVLTVQTQKLLAGEITQRVYDLAVAEIDRQREQAQAELTRLQRAPVQAPIRPLAALLADVRGWVDTLHSADVAGQRDVLGQLVEKVIPERLARGIYAARIVWQPLGWALWRLSCVAIPATLVGDWDSAKQPEDGVPARWRANAKGTVEWRAELYPEGFDIALERGDKHLDLADLERLARSVLGALTRA